MALIKRLKKLSLSIFTLVFTINTNGCGAQIYCITVIINRIETVEFLALRLLLKNSFLILDLLIFFSCLSLGLGGFSLISF